MPRIRTRWVEFCSGLLVVVCLASSPLVNLLESRSAAAQVNLVDLKAAFIVNFLRFVEWPEERVPGPDSPYVIGVLNDDDLERAVASASEGRTIEGSRIAVRRLSSIDDGWEAHLVFIGGGEQRRLGSLVQQLSGWQVLTVGDTPGYGRAGVMLNLIVANERVQFEANTTTASLAGIKLRSSLLRLARIVG